MGDALRNRNVALLFGAGLVSSLGDWLLVIGFPFYVFQVTGSTLATGTMFVVEMLPGLVLGSLAGAFVDRWDRRRTMIVADLARAILLLPLLLFHSADQVWIVYAVSFGLSTVSRFFGPARGALIPGLVGGIELKATNALLGIGDEVAMLVGAPLGGALLASLGLPDLVLLDGASFLLSAFMVGFVRNPSAVSSSEEATVERGIADGLRIWHDVRAGLQLIRASRVAESILAIQALAALGQGLIVVLWVVFFETILHGDSLGYGAVQTAVAVGTIAGGFLIGSAGNDLPASTSIGAGGVGVGALLLATFNLPSVATILGLRGSLIPGVLILQVLMGIPAMWQAVSLRTLLQETIGDEYRGRVLGTSGTLTSLCLLVGSTLGSGLGDRLGPTALLDVAAILYALSGAAGFLLLGRSVARS